MYGCARNISFSRIYNNLLRTLVFIILLCANINNAGISFYVNNDNLIINQNLIMSHQSSVDTSNMLPKIRQLTKDIVINNSNSHINDNIIDTNTEDSNNNKETILDDIYKTPMYFGTENSTVITTQIGATAHIPCTIHHIGDGVVSWIRRKDYHLLTVGLTTYSSDERFSATHLKHSEDWTLQIKFVQLRDAGVYECQVSTHPPTSIFLHLDVVEARAEITGPPIRYLTPGSTLRLLCRVVQNTEASEFIFWYHDNRMINYDIDRGINVSTEADFQSSELIILKTRREHSGNYTCVASNAQPASVLVHIFKGTPGSNAEVGSCIKCTVIGRWDKRGRHMSYPKIHCPLRTNESFRFKLDDEHHKEDTPLTQLPIDMVDDFVVADSLHLFDLGDNPAAMYHGHVGSSNKSYQNSVVVKITLIFSIYNSVLLMYVKLFV